jgi:spore coat polysaccharide biosynthesis predicted glycosyltransferase SpsG
MTDPANATETVLRGISESGFAFSVDVAMGPASANLSKIRSLVDQSGDRFALHVGTDQMASLMLRADLAFGAAGTTSWERCCLGLPTVMILTAANQETIAHELQQTGAAISLGNAWEARQGDVSNVLQELHERPSRLSEMCQSAAAICDGLGASRVVKEMMS